MDVSTMDGRGYAKFLIAGTYFLRKYRGVLNDLNVFPVPDGDTGTNMYLTVRSAALAAGRVRDRRLVTVAAAAAQGSLMEARGNSGVIISQMLRGFAHHLRHRAQADGFTLATALREAAAAARGSLLKPVEGTILSVADAAAEAAYRLALREPDLYRLARGIVRAANDALERTPEQLPALAEAGVVDSGGAGFVYFIEGILGFLPHTKERATAFPRRPARRSAFTTQQVIGEHKYCTELVLEEATCGAHDLRDALSAHGESLLVIGAPPTLKVHIHTDEPEKIRSIAARFGVPMRVKVDDMERQHQMLLVDRPATMRSIVVVVPGPGFARIVTELGAEVTVAADGNPSVRDLLLAVNKTMSDHVYLMLPDPNLVLAGREVCTLTTKRVELVATGDIVGGIAMLLAFGGEANATPTLEELGQAAGAVASVQVFYAGKDAQVGETAVARGDAVALTGGTLYAGGSLAEAAGEAVRSLNAQGAELLTLYYGGVQKEKDAQCVSELLRASFPWLEVEYYYGGMPHAQYWIALE
ncbi:MAG: DAK2 domain-containing protein [Vulcanimicrobiaceae bacterium]